MKVGYGNRKCQTRYYSHIYRNKNNAAYEWKDGDVEDLWKECNIVLNKKNNWEFLQNSFPFMKFIVSYSDKKVCRKESVA